MVPRHGCLARDGVVNLDDARIRTQLETIKLKRYWYKNFANPENIIIHMEVYTRMYLLFLLPRPGMERYNIVCTHVDRKRHIQRAIDEGYSGEILIRYPEAGRVTIGGKATSRMTQQPAGTSFGDKRLESCRLR